MKLGWTIAEYGAMPNGEPKFLAIKRREKTICVMGGRDQVGVTEADRVNAKLIIGAMAYIDHVATTDDKTKKSN